MTKTVSLDSDLAAKAEKLFTEIGLDLDTAVKLFLLQALRDRGLPFTPKLSAVPETAASLSAAESRRMTGDSETAGSVPSAKTVFPSPAPEEFPSPENDSEPLDVHELPKPEAVVSDQSSDSTDSREIPVPGQSSELMAAFRKIGLIGTPLRRIRTLNRIYAVGDTNLQVSGWRSVLITGDEPFALDFGSVRVELGYQNGGSLRMMDGRLPDKVLEADAICPRDMSPIFSSIIGRPLAGVSSSTDEDGSECLHLHFSGGNVLNFSAGGEWCRLRLTDPSGSPLYAPEAVWVRLLGAGTAQSLFHPYH